MRDPDHENARAFFSRGAAIERVLDPTDPEALEGALARCHGVFLAGQYWGSFSADHVKREADAVGRAARAAGVHHLVYATLPDSRGLGAVAAPPASEEGRPVPLSDSKASEQAHRGRWLRCVLYFVPKRLPLLSMPGRVRDVL